MNEEYAVIGYYCTKNKEECIQKCNKSLNTTHRVESSGISYYNDNSWNSIMV